MNDESKTPETPEAAVPAGAVAKRRLGICPFSLTPRPPSAISGPDGQAAEQRVDLIGCIGPQCELWKFEPGKDPLAYGDCAFTITAQGISNIALRVEQAFRSGMKEAQEEQAHA